MIETETDLIADMREVVDALATGGRVDPETYRRVRKRGERIRQEMQAKGGQTDLAVELIRQVRDER